MTAATDEPIAALLERSSLGTRQVRALTAGTPAPIIRHVLANLAASMQHPARSSRPSAIYSIPVHPTRAAQADEQGATMATRRTSATAARAASKVLRDGRTSKTSKTAAGSALSQRAGRSAKRK